MDEGEAIDRGGRGREQTGKETYYVPFVLAYAGIVRTKIPKRIVKRANGRVVGVVRGIMMVVYWMYLDVQGRLYLRFVESNVL